MKPLDVSSWGGRDVLLLAPHPDDEVIGCGGTVHLLARAGARIVVVVAADGAGGVGGGATPSERIEESREACSLLGAEPPLFLGLASQALRDDPAWAAEALDGLAGREAFDLLLLPSPLERHPTHRAALLAGLLSRSARPGAEAWGYGAWDAIPAVSDAWEVDTTRARQARTRALAAHRSQMQSRSLGPGIAGREMAQAAFSRLTGDETRKSVERLLDLAGLAPLPAEARTVAGARARTRDWLTERSVAWAAERWGPEAG